MTRILPLWKTYCVSLSFLLTVGACGIFVPNDDEDSPDPGKEVTFDQEMIASQTATSTETATQSATSTATDTGTSGPLTLARQFDGDYSITLQNTLSSEEDSSTLVFLKALLSIVEGSGSLSGVASSESPALSGVIEVNDEGVIVGSFNAEIEGSEVPLTLANAMATGNLIRGDYEYVLGENTVRGSFEGVRQSYNNFTKEERADLIVDAFDGSYQLTFSRNNIAEESVGRLTACLQIQDGLISQTVTGNFDVEGAIDESGDFILLSQASSIVSLAGRGSIDEAGAITGSYDVPSGSGTWVGERVESCGFESLEHDLSQSDSEYVLCAVEASFDNTSELTFLQSLLGVFDQNDKLYCRQGNRCRLLDRDLSNTFETEDACNEACDRRSGATCQGTQNNRPEARVSEDQSVVTGTRVILDASESFDLNNDLLMYQWSFSAVPPGSEATLSHTTTVNPTFIADTSGVYKLQLVVNDGQSESDPQEITITASSPPQANAGSDQTGLPREEVILDGTSSVDPDGDELSYTWTLLSKPEDAVMEVVESAALSTFRFTPETVGLYAFELEVSDGISVARDTVNVIVNPFQLSFENLQLSTPEETSLAFSLLSSISVGIFLGELSFSITASPDHGTLSGESPNLVYTPHPNFHGKDSFSFTSDSSFLNTKVGTITIDVTPVNDPPLISGTPSQLVQSGQSYRFIPSVQDVDGDSLSFSIENLPSWLQFDFQTGELSGVPTQSDGGVYSDIEISVSDVEQQVSLPRFDITVKTPPVLPDFQQVFIDEDQDLSLNLAAADSDNDALSYETLLAPTNGSLIGDFPDLQYRPNPNFHGTDLFTYVANDGERQSNVGVVSVLVNPVPDAPVISGHAPGLVRAGETYIFIPALENIDQLPVTFEIVNKPTWAQFNSSTGGLVGVPNNNQGGVSSEVKILARSGEFVSRLDPFDIRVSTQPVILQNLSVSTNEEESVAILLAAVDSDQDTLNYRIETAPLHGTLDEEGLPSLLYTPKPDFYGTDQLTFTVSDGESRSNVGTVTITVTPSNDAPTISGTPAQGVEAEKAYFFTPNAEDIDGDALTFRIDGKPDWADFNSSTGVLSGVPTQAEGGVYGGITIHVDDPHGGSDSLDTFSIRVSTKPRVLETLQITIAEDTPEVIQLLAEDTDQDALTYSFTSATHGTLDGSGPNVTYTPNADFYGSDRFTYRAHDGTHDSNIGLVLITVEARPDDPVISGDAPEEAIAGVSYHFAPVASDVDGETLSFTINPQPPWASFNESTGVLSGVPSADHGEGTEGIVITVNDSSGRTARLDAFSIRVSTPPVIENTIEVITDEDSFADLTLDADDSDNDSLTYDYTEPSHGTLSGEAPNLRYTPDANFNGSDLFTFEATDGNEVSNTGLVLITVNAINDSPIISGSPSPTAEEGVTYLFHAIAEDVDGDALLFRINSESLPEWLHFDTSLGVLSGVPGPEDGTALEPISVEIEVSDQQSTFVPLAPFTISVATAPRVEELLEVIMNEDEGSRSIELSSFDSDGDTPSYSVASQPSYGTLDASENPFIYTPNPDFHGIDSFTYTANDGRVGSNVGLVTIIVNPVNDVPTIDGPPENLTATARIPYSFTPSVNDVEQDGIVFRIQNQPHWMDFNPNTGELSGIALDSHAGDYTDIEIEAFDGEHTVVLDPFTVTVVANPLIATAQSVETTQEIAITFTLTSNDAENPNVTYEIVSHPPNGELSFDNLPSVTYQPDPGYFGPDSFTFKAVDGLAESNVATVSIDVKEPRLCEECRANDVRISEQKITIQLDDSITLDSTQIAAAEDLSQYTLRSPVGVDIDLEDGQYTATYHADSKTIVIDHNSEDDLLPILSGFELTIDYFAEDADVTEGVISVELIIPIVMELLLDE